MMMEESDGQKKEKVEERTERELREGERTLGKRILRGRSERGKEERRRDMDDVNNEFWQNIESGSIRATARNVTILDTTTQVTIPDTQVTILDTQVKEESGG